MTDPRDRAEELQDMASDLPHGPAQLALLEEAVQLADSVQDIDLAFHMRDDLMAAALFSGRPDIMLVAFSWCLAQYDRDPKRFNPYNLLWKYKWVMGNSWKFPEISRSRLEALLADMDRRYRKAGSTLYAVASERRDLLVNFGERRPARTAHAEFRKCRRDSLSDCIACVANNNCDYYCFQRQWGRAVQAAQPVLQGRLTCVEQPHNILGNVLLPLFLLGRQEEGKAYQRQGYRLVSQDSHFVRKHAQHLRFVVLIGDLAQAKRLLERHLPSAIEIVTLNDRFEFLLAARLWSDRVASQGTHKLKVRLPKGLPATDADGKSDVRALGEWFMAQVREIARRFDARNGTDAFQQQIDELTELLRRAVD
jgi:hypothetical protein